MANWGDNAKSVDEWHNAIRNALDGKKSANTSGNPIPTPTTLQAPAHYATIPPRPGQIKAVRDIKGQERVYRFQDSGKWVPTDSDEDLYAGTAGESGKEVSMAVESNLIPLAEVYLDNGFNVLLLGLHGTGKTASIVDIAKKRGIKMKYYSCATLDPFTDLVGVPFPRVRCSEHGEFETRKEHRELHPGCEQQLTEDLKMIRPREVDEAEIIFFDEFNRADPKTMNAVFEIIQFRSINGESLPNLKACWAAMNPPDDDYEVEKLDPALVDRFDVFIDIVPKPSVSYMTQFMRAPIAKALKLWWDEHEQKIKVGTLDDRVDYVSPRRLLKIGLVWEATKNTRAVNQSLPLGGSFDRNKLGDYLKAAQKTVDAEDLGISPAELDPEESKNVGDRPAPQFVYQPANLRLKEAELVQFLQDNPLSYETHNKVSAAYKQGVGGEELVLKHGKILNALNPSVLEALVNTYPAAKQNQMRAGFAKLYKDQKGSAKSLTNLHSVLKAGSKGVSDFPQTL